jgi:hypothetical protein
MTALRLHGLRGNQQKANGGKQCENDKLATDGLETNHQKNTPGECSLILLSLDEPWRPVQAAIFIRTSAVHLCGVNVGGTWLPRVQNLEKVVREN